MKKSKLRQLIREEIRKLNESKPKSGVKSFYQMDNVGKSKYTISKYDGKSTHKDGSPFYDIKIFSNKSDLEKYKNTLIKLGYVEE